VCNTDSVQDFEQSTTQALSVVCIVDFGEPEESTFTFPSRECLFFYPMACDSKIAISVTGLPRITSNIDRPEDSVTLHITTRSDNGQHVNGLKRAFRVFLRLVRWFLNILVISARVAFLPGILTPLVARAAISIISLNFGCSSA
jgi:hypothetical protein